MLTPNKWKLPCKCVKTHRDYIVHVLRARHLGLEQVSTVNAQTLVHTPSSHKLTYIWVFVLECSKVVKFVCMFYEFRLEDIFDQLYFLLHIVRWLSTHGTICLRCQSVSDTSILIVQARFGFSYFKSKKIIMFFSVFALYCIVIS